MSIANNIQSILQEIEAAKARSPLAAEHVQLLAVSKTKPVEMIREAYLAGQLHFGENKVQEIVPKQEALPEAKWHLIGHLQTNKVKYIIGKTELIHSLDSLNLAAEIEKRSAAKALVTDCLVQVNIAEEDSKSGLFVPELTDFLEAMADYPHIQVRGLMTIGPLEEDAEAARPVFRRLRELFEKAKADAMPHIKMDYLSMGMSHDFGIAVEEGANIVRVGSAIFGSRPPMHV